MSNLLQPTIISDGGPWASHDYPCPIHQNTHAVIDVGTGIFHPSWRAQSEGWRLVKASGWRLALIKLLCPNQAID